MKIDFSLDDWRIIRDALLEESHRLRGSDLPPEDRPTIPATRADRIARMDAIRADIAQFTFGR